MISLISGLACLAITARAMVFVILMRKGRIRIGGFWAPHFSSKLLAQAGLVGKMPGAERKGLEDGLVVGSAADLAVGSRAGSAVGSAADLEGGSEGGKSGDRADLDVQELAHMRCMHALSVITQPIAIAGVLSLLNGFWLVFFTTELQWWIQLAAGLSALLFVFAFYRLAYRMALSDLRRS